MEELTEMRLSLDIEALFTKVSNNDLRQSLRVSFGLYKDEMYNRLLDCALNLGHTGYGHSTSTEIGIDKLRERTLDFLSIPKED